MSILRRALCSALILAAFALQTPAQAQAPAAQTTNAGGVTVKITPRPVADGATQWEFAVVLDTHSQNLDDDLVKSAVLVADGAQISPTEWRGAGAGGHHREGVLVFAAPDKPANSVEIRIQRSGESAPRVFRWETGTR
jgi:hypothetical protein